MRAIVQRVSEAEVTVAGESVGAIDGEGLVVLVGVTHGDTSAQARALAAKLHTLRILDGDKSCADVGAPLVVVSQFTVYGDTTRGRRPSWQQAAPGPIAAPLVEAVVAELRSLGAHVATGRFGAHMKLRLVNDGPVTLIIDVDA